MERSRAERRGAAPTTVWGARAVAALHPWEEGELCLSHAVALALQAAYEEGKAGLKPSYPNTEVDAPAATVAECEDCVAEKPRPTRIVRTLANLISDDPDDEPPAPVTPRKVIRKPAPAKTSAIEKYTTLTSRPTKHLARRSS
jgi:hypothetical protein